MNLVLKLKTPQIDLFKKMSFNINNSHSIQYVSNLFLDKSTEKYEMPVSGQSIVLLGNIGKLDHPKYKNFIDYCSHNFENVFVVPGMYECDLNEHIIEFKNDINVIRYELDESIKHRTNVYSLVNQEYMFRDYYIIGSMMYPENHELKSRCEEDYNYMTNALLNLSANQKILILSHFEPNSIIIDKEVLSKYEHKWKSIKKELDKNKNIPEFKQFEKEINGEINKFIKDDFYKIIEEKQDINILYGNTNFAHKKTIYGVDFMTNGFNHHTKYNPQVLTLN